MSWHGYAMWPPGTELEWMNDRLFLFIQYWNKVVVMCLRETKSSVE